MTARDARFRIVAIRQAPRRWLRTLAKDRQFQLALAAGPAFWGGWWLWAGLVPQWPGWSAALVLSVAVYPILEEIVFRGLLQGWLWQRTGGRGIGILSWANLGASAAFATAHLVHHSPWLALGVLIPGLVFGYFRDRYESVLPPIVLHMVYNAGAVLVVV